jgi:hypothetical protein
MAAMDSNAARSPPATRGSHDSVWMEELNLSIAFA